MKKVQSIVLAILTLSFGYAQAQESQHVVTTNGGVDNVYFDVLNKEVKTISGSNWDLAFEVAGFTGSVLVNGQKGMEVFASPYMVSEWASFDTTGYQTWRTQINSLTSWSDGALNQNRSKDIDLGWGMYNQSTHVITGDSIFLLKTADGGFKKLYIKNLNMGTFNIVYSNVDGTNEQAQAIAVRSYPNLNFVHFSMSTNAIVDQEPDKASWDIMFTKFIQPIPVGGGQFQNYPVSGVLINKGVEVAQRNNVSVTDNDTNGLSWNTDMSEIGGDWKMFDGTKYVFAQDQVYFLRLPSGNVYKLYFTNYEGGSKGNFHMNMEAINQSVSIQANELIELRIYPNPSADVLNIDISTEAISSVRIFNAAGLEVYQGVENQIAVAGFTSGVYFVEVTTAKGVIVQRVIVQ